MPGASTRISRRRNSAQALGSRHYIEGGVRSMERSFVLCRARSADGEHRYPKLELVRLTIRAASIPRRTWMSPLSGRGSY